MSLLLQQTPKDQFGTPANAVYSPNQGVVALAGGTASIDGANNYSAPAQIVNVGASIPPNLAATPVVASNTGAAAAAVSTSLPAVAGKTNYITGIVVTSTNPAATVSGTVTISGLIGGSNLSFQFVESSTFGGELIIPLPLAIPASAPNTAITVTLPAIASGGAGAVTVVGFVQ